jgi:hypothetical protein
MRGAVGHNGEASVVFHAAPPLSAGETLPTAFLVTSTPGNHARVGNASPILVGGLTNGVAYTFTVVALTQPNLSNNNENNNGVGVDVGGIGDGRGLATSVASAHSNAVTPQVNCKQSNTVYFRASDSSCIVERKVES